MIAVPRTITHEQYASLHLLNVSLEKVGLVTKAEHTATVQFEDLPPDRNGDQKIGHSLAVAALAREHRVPAEGQALAHMHDVREDGQITLGEISIGFGKKYGPIMAYALWAITKWDWMQPIDYYRQIVEAVKFSRLWWIVVIKILDRLHNLIRPYGGKAHKRERMLRETLSEFRWMCEECEEYIPKYYRKRYKHLVSEVMSHAEQQLKEMAQHDPA